MATNHLIKTSAQVKVEGLVIGQVEKEDGRHLVENMEDEKEEEVEEEAQQEDSMGREKEKEKVKRRKKNTQNKHLVLEERVRKHNAACLECVSCTVDYTICLISVLICQASTHVFCGYVIV